MTLWSNILFLTMYKSMMIVYEEKNIEKSYSEEHQEGTKWCNI